MACAKVILNGTTLIDVTNDTVTADALFAPITATRKDGVEITGSLVESPILQIDVTGTAATSATLTNPAITAEHYVINNAQIAASNVSWTTAAGQITLSCADGIPAMTIFLAIAD